MYFGSVGGHIRCPQLDDTWTQELRCRHPALAGERLTACGIGTVIRNGCATWLRGILGRRHPDKYEIILSCKRDEFLDSVVLGKLLILVNKSGHLARWLATRFHAPCLRFPGGGMCFSQHVPMTLYHSTLYALIFQCVSTSICVMKQLYVRRAMRGCECCQHSNRIT